MAKRDLGTIGKIPLPDVGVTNGKTDMLPFCPLVLAYFMEILPVLAFGALRRTLFYGDFARRCCVGPALGCEHLIL